MDEDEDDTGSLESKKTSYRTLGSKRKRSAVGSRSGVGSSINSSSPHGTTLGSIGIAHASTQPTVQSATSASTQKITLKSAFRPPQPPPKSWTRNIKVVTSNFRRFEATFIDDGGPMSGQVHVNQNTVREVIDVADKSAWTLVSADGGCAFDTDGPGFIGKGSTKGAIYVCHHDFDDVRLLGNG